MPTIIRHVDKIARVKDRDVVFIKFNFMHYLMGHKNVDDIPVRKKILSWLKEHDINIEQCGPGGDSGIIEGYPGDFYIDVPYDLENPTYLKLQEYFEDKDGKQRSEFNPEEVNFCLYPLEYAKKLAYMDEPDYWDNVND